MSKKKPNTIEVVKDKIPTYSSPLSAFMVTTMMNVEDGIQNYMNGRPSPNPVPCFPGSNPCTNPGLVPCAPPTCCCCDDSNPLDADGIVYLKDTNAKPAPVIPMIPMDYTSEALDRITPYAAKNTKIIDVLFNRDKVGNTLMTDGTIHTHGIENAAIPSIAVDINYKEGIVESVPGMVMLTNNAGFRFVGVDPKVGTSDGHILIEDLGQVDVPVFVGDAHQPSAILVPMTNRKALIDGAEIAITMADAIDTYKVNCIENEDDF